MLNTETKEKFLMNDKVVIPLLKNSLVGKKFVSRIISEIIKVPYEEVYNNMRYINDDRIFTSKSVDAKTDVMVETKKFFINLEIFYTKGSARERQMDTYNYELYLSEEVVEKIIKEHQDNNK
ncbi:MAG: hypothetical protein IKN63_05620 [Bacilli bacterium]|nr:hypothetical protein [Bacilli bacterium]